MKTDILRILKFKLSGKFAHFRKFYTNSSSLSYIIPPRTVIIGMLASILEYERDSYYTILAPEKIRISVSVMPGTFTRKQMQSLNYLHESYYKALIGGTGKIKSMHSQCKLELLMTERKNLSYTVYVGAMDEDALGILGKIESKISNKDMGFGVYLGQRQFRADIEDFQFINGVRFLEKSDYIDSLCLQKNAELDMERNPEAHIIVDQMPIHMQEKKQGKTYSGRELASIDRVIYEKSGKRIFGNFRDCYEVGETIISFYERL